MNLCNYIDIIPLKKINDWDKTGIPLYSNSDSIRMLSAKDMSYISKVDNTDNGRLCKETLSFKINRNATSNIYIAELSRRCVIKCYTSDTYFFIGTQDFPAVVTFTDDIKYITISVTAKNPVV